VSRKIPVNRAASIRQKLLNIALREKVDFQRILGDYVAERTLWRLWQIGTHNELIFKGGRLISVWLGRFRGTRDIDFSAHRALDEKWLLEIFNHIGRVEAQDGLRYDHQSIKVQIIRSRSEFQGLRLTMYCYIEQARIPLQVDVGFSPNKVPGEHLERIKSIIGGPSINIRAYSPQAVIGEKLLAAVVHGEYNSRMKDFYDIVMLSRKMEFSGTDLAAGIRAAFSLDSRNLPPHIEISLENAEVRWKAFIRKSGAESHVTFFQVKKEIEEFINPCLEAMEAGLENRIVWKNHSTWMTVV